MRASNQNLLINWLNTQIIFKKAKIGLHEIQLGLAFLTQPNYFYYSTAHSGAILIQKRH